MTKKILLGNEAVAYGLLAGGASVVTAYPGTPSSEIASTAMSIVHENNLEVHVEWSVNEKTAFEIAYTNSISGRRSAVAMKQVGLNVASDAVMSAAYMGTKGGLVIVVADDPGPHSSQTEQDTRLFAMFSKLPVLDPSCPREAMLMAREAFEISEKYSTPVILRPTTRVCHSRQGIVLPAIEKLSSPAAFEKNPSRWAATPGPRLKLHHELNIKLANLSHTPKASPVRVLGPDSESDAIVASGAAFGYAKDLLSSTKMETALYKIDMPFPACRQALDEIASRHGRVLVLEETDPVIEMQFTDNTNVSGHMDGLVPGAGELTPDRVSVAIAKFSGEKPPAMPAVPPGKKPSLCPGCAHRAAFYAIKKAVPNGIYTSDIGCYTLGLNLGAVDTCLCMGAAISQAAGFFHAYRNAENPPGIVATIGDSTFFHAGIPPLINALSTGARFVLVILDNSTTAMTGHQPTPATGGMSNDSAGITMDIEKILSGLGVETITTADPYDISGFVSVVRKAREAMEDSGRVTAVIAKHPCIRVVRPEPVRLVVTERCNGCGYCINEFECPALVMTEAGKVTIDTALCNGCGLCEQVCPRHAITKGI